MKITLKHLETCWNKARIRKTHSLGFFIGSDKLLTKEFQSFLPMVDAIWTNRHDIMVKKRDMYRRVHKTTKQIFISQICDVAVDEYSTVCDLIEPKRIVLVGTSKAFLKKSKQLLSKIDIEILCWKIEEDL